MIVARGPHSVHDANGCPCRRSPTSTTSDAQAAQGARSGGTTPRRSGPASVSLTATSKPAHPRTGAETTSTEVTLADGGAPRATSSRKARLGADAPSTCTSTPAGPLRTHPRRPRRSARRHTKGRKPTPWTIPPMRTRHASTGAPSIAGPSATSACTAATAAGTAAATGPLSPGPSPTAATSTPTTTSRPGIRSRARPRATASATPAAWDDEAPRPGAGSGSPSGWTRRRCTVPAGAPLRTASTTTATAVPVHASTRREGSPSTTTTPTSAGRASSARATTAGPTPSSRRRSLPTAMTTRAGPPTGGPTGPPQLGRGGGAVSARPPAGRGSGWRTRCTDRGSGWPARTAGPGRRCRRRIGRR